MNNISRIKKILESVNLSINNDNYFASLTNSLILIDICAKIYSPKVTENNKRYKKWIDDNFITKLEGLSSTSIYLSPNNIWFLRCAMVHEGSADPTTNQSYQKFGEEKVRDIVPTIFPKNFDKKVVVADQNEEYPTLFFDIIYFCENVLSIATDWVDENTELVKESDLNLFSLAISEIATNNNLIILRV